MRGFSAISFSGVIDRRLRSLLNVLPGEGRPLFWAFLYFFTLMCSYYIIRPLRDEMGVAGGVENLHWLFTGTFLVMLVAVPAYGWLATCFPRSRFLSLIYLFFSLSLLGFYILLISDLDQVIIARGFFIWTSVYNLFVVSVFWSFMTDLFDDEQARRYFGLIAAGGTAGAITGPILASSLALIFGIKTLLLVSAGLLLWAVVCINRLRNWAQDEVRQKPHPLSTNTASNGEEALGGSIWGGVRLLLGSPYLLGIALMMLLFTTLSTFLYFQQAEIIRDNFSDPARRTAVFAGMDLAVNILTLTLQIVVTSRLIRWLGLPWTLALVPLLLSVGFAALFLMPTLGVIILVQVIRRAGNYAITRPGRELLYVVLDRESKYKAKNLNDTLMYRGGDALSAWFYAGLRSIGMSLSQVALLAVPLAILWAWLAFRLGRRQEALSAHRSVDAL